MILSAPLRVRDQIATAERCVEAFGPQVKSSHSEVQILREGRCLDLRGPRARLLREYEFRAAERPGHS